MCRVKVSRFSRGSSLDVFLVFLVGFLFLAVPALGSEGEGNQSVEAQVSRLMEKTRFGGWLDLLYLDSDRTDARKHFDLHHLYVYFDTSISERWRLFGEVEFGHAPHLEEGDNKGELKLERGYAEYYYSDWLKARFGKFNTPFGIWTPTHWAIYVDTVARPIHEDNKYVPVKSVGVEILGNPAVKFSTDHFVEINYSLFVSNGGEYEGTDDPEDDDLGGGMDLNFRFDETYLLGFSLYTRKNASPSFGTPGRRETSFMAYGEAELPFNLLVRGEMMIQDRSEGDRTVDAWYGKVKWKFREDAYLNYRYGSGDDEKRADGGRQRVHTFTVGYWPLPEIRLKAEISLHDFKDPSLEDYTEWVAWLGCVF